MIFTIVGIYPKSYEVSVDFVDAVNADAAVRTFYEEVPSRKSGCLVVSVFESMVSDLLSYKYGSAAVSYKTFKRLEKIHKCAKKNTTVGSTTKRG